MLLGDEGGKTENGGVEASLACTLAALRLWSHRAMVPADDCHSSLLPTRSTPCQVPRSLRLTFDEEATPAELARLARKGRKGLVAATLRQEGAAAEHKRKQRVGRRELEHASRSGT